MAEQVPVEELSFEEALEELEKLSGDMAAGSLSLRESVSGYERGTALLRRCRAELADARRRIEVLRADEHADGDDTQDNGERTVY